MDRNTTYQGILRNRGKTVYKKDALHAAMEYCGVMCRPDIPLNTEFAGMIIEWVFSGDWIETDSRR